MGRYLLRRALGAIPLLVGVTLLSFIITQGLGTDPVWELAGRNPTSAEINELQAQLGRDRSWLMQYVDYLSGLPRLELGHSLMTGESVRSLLIRSVPVTLALMVPGLVIGIVLAMVLGYLAARWKGRGLDRLISSISTVGMSLSLVIVVMLCQMVFSVWLAWFPARGWSTETLYQWLLHVTVPTIIVIMINLGHNVRFFRGLWVEGLNLPAVQSARAFGLPEVSIFRRRLLPWAIGPIMTRLVFAIPILLFSGSLVIESHFGIPGVGRVFYNAILSGDQPVVLAVVALASVLVVVALTIVDASVRWFDPRVRLS